MPVQRRGRSARPGQWDPGPLPPVTAWLSEMRGPRTATGSVTIWLHLHEPKRHGPSHMDSHLRARPLRKQRFPVGAEARGRGQGWGGLLLTVSVVTSEPNRHTRLGQTVPSHSRTDPEREMTHHQSEPGGAFNNNLWKGSWPRWRTVIRPDVWVGGRTWVVLPMVNNGGSPPSR